MDRDVLVKRCIEFSDKTFDILRKMKKDNDENGPKADIDISVEEYWSKRSGEILE